MRLALYYPWIYLTSGAERTILEVARRSRHQVAVFTNEYQAEATFPELRQVDIRVLSRVPVKRTIGAVAAAAARILGQRLDLAGFDALLVVCEGLGDLVTLRHPGIPAFCICLTPLRIVFDPHYRAQYLRARGLGHRAAIVCGSPLFRAMDRFAWRRYRRVFAISLEVKRRILAGGLARDEKVEILHPGIDLSAFTPSSTRERFFFVPGRIMWTKNLELAIGAYREFLRLVPDPAGWRLRLAGIVDRKSQPYLERLRALADGLRVDFVVQPSDAEMREAYRSCFATLFTAFNEDWGLVVIEAMACGKPVVATNRGGPVEIVRNGRDGLLAEPDPRAFAEAMVRLVTDPHLYADIASSAPQHAARFGWGPFIDRLDHAIEAGLGPPLRQAVTGTTAD
jgi:glycosyltransferase involved in cell wall biosynthesis